MAKPIPVVVVVVGGGILRVPITACVPGEEGRRMKKSPRTLWRRAGERAKRQTGRACFYSQADKHSAL